MLHIPNEIPVFYCRLNVRMEIVMLIKRHTCIFINLLFMVLLVAPSSSLSQEGLKGDVNRDGSIDSRDALKVLQYLESLVALDEDERYRADVFPHSDSAEGAIGDGQITIDDAQRILDSTVGLIPLGEITGRDYSQPPLIDSFAPNSGPAGAVVTITGRNFYPSQLNQTLVLFGGEPGDIVSITGTEIQVAVPDKAKTALIQIVAPSGSATTADFFTVTKRIYGTVNIGDTSNMTITGTYGEEISLTGNTFEAEVSEDRITLIAAVESGDSLNNYLYLYIPSDEESPSIVIDERSTAKALVFIHPFFYTDDVAAARRLLDILESLPEISDLAQVIETRYPAGADGLDDPAVAEAYEKAAVALALALPESLSDETSGNALAKTARRNVREDAPSSGSVQTFSYLSPGGNTVTVYQAGASYICAEYVGEHHEIVPQLTTQTSTNFEFEPQPYSPLDWKVVMDRVDVSSLKQGMTAPSEQALESMSYTGYSRSTVLPAPLWTYKIDILGEALNAIYFGKSGWINLGDDGLPLQDEEEGVYILRGYSGVLASNDTRDVRALRTIPDGSRNAFDATAVNMCYTLLDFFSLFGSSSEGVKKSKIAEAAQAAIKNARNNLLGTAGANFAFNLSERDLKELLLDVLTHAGRAVLQIVNDRSIDEAKNKLRGTALQALKSSNAILAALGKVSTVGRIAERLTGLCGKILNPLQLEFAPGPTPLESIFIVVGDPFSPVIESFSPKEGDRGEIVTITGKHFLSAVDNNTVTIGGLPAKIVEVKNDRTLVVEVPEGLEPYTDVELTVKTTASHKKAVAPQTFRSEPIPVLKSVSPQNVFPKAHSETPELYQSFPGTLVTLRGYNFLAPEGMEHPAVVLKDSIGNEIEIDIDTRTDTKIAFYVPAIKASGVDLSDDWRLSVLSPDRKKKSREISLFLCAAPYVQSSPQKARAGETVTIVGSNFNLSNVRVQDYTYEFNGSDSRIDFPMPAEKDDPDGATITITNPSGIKMLTVKREEGLSAPVVTAASAGLIIPVTAQTDGIKPDGAISADEAVAFANGSENPFGPKWDDRNEEWYSHYYQLRKTVDRDEDGVADVDENGDVIYHYYFEDKPRNVEKVVLETGSGPDPEYRAYYRSDHYHAYHPDHPGEILTGFVERENLDETEANMEEGDFVKDPHEVLERDGEQHIMPDSIKNFSSEKRSDTIQIPSRAFAAQSLTLGEQDRLEFSDSPSSKLIVEGSLTMPAGSSIYRGTVRTTASVIFQGHGVNIRDATIESEGNGVVIENGFNHSISSSVIYNTGGHGVYIKGGGLNEFGNVRFVECRKDGLHCENGAQNYYIGLYAQDCSECGISLNEESLSRVYDVNASACKTGVSLLNSKDLIVGTAASERCSSDGVVVQDCQNLDISLLRAVNNGANGIVFKNASNLSYGDGNPRSSGGFGVEAVDNEKSGLSVEGGCERIKAHGVFAGNDKGLSISGDGNKQLAFSNLLVGLAAAEDEAYAANGNKSDGIVVSGDTEDVVFSDVRVYGNQGAGIVVKGNDVKNILVEWAGVGAPFFSDPSGVLATLPGNRADGIQLGEGCSDVAIRNCRIENCGGNAVSIDGESTNSISIEECYLGSKECNADLSAPLRPNGGYGLYVANHARQISVEQCTFGYNLLGGLYALNLQDPLNLLESDQYALQLRLCWFGYKNAAPDYNSYDPLDMPPAGHGIHLSKTSRVLVEGDKLNNNYGFINNRIFGYEKTGFLVDGGESGRIELKGLRSDCNESHGVRIVDASGVVANGLYASENGSDGIRVEQSENVTLLNLSGNTNDGDGIHIEQSLNLVLGKNVVSFDSYGYITTAQYFMATQNGGYGYYVADSDSVVVNNPGIEESAKDGLLVSKSTRVKIVDPMIRNNLGSGVRFTNSTNGAELIRGTFSANQGSGVVMEDSSDVAMYGTGGTIDNNFKDAVKVQNCSQVVIGKPNRGYYVTSPNAPCLTVGGNLTTGVSVEACSFMDSTAEAAVVIEGGVGIRFGGDDANAPNQIENNANTGLLIRGANTKVNVTNNVFGEPEEWETGTKEGGNANGLVLDNGVGGVTIANNLFNNNRENGIVLQNGANGNQVLRNRIYENGGDGILATGANTVHNLFSQNSISRNNGLGIHLVNGGNETVTAPTIDEIQRSSNYLKGFVYPAAPDGSSIEVFADDGDEGAIFIGSTKLYGNNFYLSASIPELMKLHAVITHPDGNASQFGETVLGDSQDTFLFTAVDGESRGVYLSDPSEPEPVALLADGSNNYDPVLHTSGESILFTSDRSGNQDVWIADSNGGNAAAVAQDPAADYDPDWYGTGDEIAFTTERFGNPEICVAPVASSGGSETLSHSNDLCLTFALMGDVGDGHGTLFHSDATVSEIQFYISNLPAEFIWRIYRAEGGVPTLDVLAEGTAEPEGIGWISIDVSDWQISGEFVVTLISVVDRQPQLGVALNGDEGYTWQYIAATNEWFDNRNTTMKTFYMIWVVTEASSSGPVRLTDNPAVDRYPDWAPDGSKIAFASDRNGTQDVWVMNPDGSQQTNLTQGEGNNTKPAWSPDGSKIAFVSDRDGNNEIYTMNADGTGLVRITNHGAGDNDPGWSLDGARILFTSDRDGLAAVYAYQSADGVPTRILRVDGAATQPAPGVFRLIGNLFAKTVNRTALRPNQLENSVQLSFDEASAEPGEIVSLSLNAASAEPVANVNVEIDYDRYLLTWIDAANAASGERSLHALNPIPGEGRIRFNWIDAYGVEGGQNLMDLQFQVKSSADRPDAQLSASVVECYGPEANARTAQAAAGSVRITGIETAVADWSVYDE